MGGARKVLEDIVGPGGYETLSKAIFRRGTQNVADPLELYLPLLVVPRAILSWLAHNIAPMPVGSIKEIKFPGRSDILINIRKEAADVYRGEMIQNGRIIHEFDKQTLPSIGGHIMTVMEQYDHLKEADKPPVVMDRDEAIREHEKLVDVLESPSHEDDKEEAKEQSKELQDYRTGTDLVEHIINANNIQMPDAEEAKWAYAHGNVKELVGVIGKLVDALVVRNMQKDSIKETEVKVPEGIRDSEVPEIPAEHKDPGTKVRVLSDNKLEQIQDYKPECKEVSQGEDARDAEPMQEKAELLEKPYESEAQRRWAHTPAGKKALGGEKAVEHWDKESKGKKLPEKVGKEEKPSIPKRVDLTPPVDPDKKENREYQKKVVSEGFAREKVRKLVAQQMKDKYGSRNFDKDEDAPAKRPQKRPQMSASQWFRMSYNQKKQHVASKYGPKGDPKAAMEAAVRAMEQFGKKPEPEKKSEMGITNPKMSAVPTGPGSMVTTKPHKPDASKIAVLKSGSSCEPNTSHTISDNLDRNANHPKTSMLGAINKEELDKGGPEKPGGAAMPKGPQPPQAPKPPVPAGKQPAQAAAKQAQAAARGQQAKPPTAPKPPANPIKIAGPKPPKSPGALKSEEYFGKLRKKPTAKSERAFHVTEQEMMQPCEHCGTPQFTKKFDKVAYAPCACFRITLNDRGFLSLEKKEQGYSLRFAKNADPETVRAFLLTLKAKLLLAKRGA